MNKLDSRYRGKDFLIGLIPSLIPAGIAVAFLFTSGTFTPLLWLGAGLVVAAIIAFINLRPYIAIGILTSIIATPLLLIGSCFALL